MNVESLLDIVSGRLDQGLGSMKVFREKELGLFKQNGFKSPVMDAYKFTNLESFFEVLPYSPKNPEEEFEVLPSTFATFVFNDGELEESVSIPGIKIKRMKDHFQEVINLFTNSNALSHLHHSLMNDGLIFEIEKNQEIATPVRIIHKLTKNSISAPTIFILGGAFSKITILEETIGPDLPYAYVNETYIKADPGSMIQHIQLDQGGPDGIIHSSVFAEVEKDATVKCFNFNTKGRLTRKNLILNLNVPGAHGESYALFLTDGKEQSDINTVINHKAPDTTSKQLAKGILSGDSKGIFTGKIHIFPQAQRVFSGQLNKNLLLSKKAQVHSQPQLEIFADDVKCSHGSTTGQMSEDELFYFEARGIPKEEARTILAHGFGLEVVQKISDAQVRDFIAPIILSHLSKRLYEHTDK